MGLRDKPTIPLFYDGMDHEMRKALESILEDEKKGSLPRPPRRAQDCRNVEDLCRYIFKLAKLDGDHQMLIVEGRVKRWVWFGHEFTDRIVKVVEEVSGQISNLSQLEELRLVATRVSAQGYERLRRVIPTATIRIFTDDDDDDAPWSQASYEGGHDGSGESQPD